MTNTLELDTADKAIIAELQVDGRMPYAKLAPLVGLSEAATRQRVNRLMERGVMQVVAITDPDDFTALVQELFGAVVDDEEAACRLELKGRLVEPGGLVSRQVELLGGSSEILVEVLPPVPLGHERRGPLVRLMHDPRHHCRVFHRPSLAHLLRTSRPNH